MASRAKHLKRPGFKIMPCSSEFRRIWASLRFVRPLRWPFTFIRLTQNTKTAYNHGGWLPGTHRNAVFGVIPLGIFFRSIIASFKLLLGGF